MKSKIIAKSVYFSNVPTAIVLHCSTAAAG